MMRYPSPERSRHDDEPGDAEADPHPHDDLGQCGGDHHAANSVARETPKFAPARRYRRSIVCTPAVVCTTIGKIDEMKIGKIGDALPTPNHRIAIGIQAIGEIGRSICKDRI